MEAYEMIKYLRIKNKLTQVDLAAKVGVSKGTISKWESGDIINIRRDKIAKLAEALETTPARLFGWQTDGGVDVGLVQLDTGMTESEASEFISKTEKPTANDELSNGDARLLAAYHKLSPDARRMFDAALFSAVQEDGKQE